MTPVIHPFHLLVIVLAGWLSALANPGYIAAPNTVKNIPSRERLGGMLNFYYREAA